MKSVVRPELPTASVGSSQAPTAAVDNSAPLLITAESTYKSGKSVQTTGATSLLISTAIFCLAGVVGLGVYIALYGSHRVFQERFAEMTLKLQLGEGSGTFGRDFESDGLGRTLFQWALQRMLKPKVSPASDRTTQTLVRAGFLSGRERCARSS